MRASSLCTTPARIRTHCPKCPRAGAGTPPPETDRSSKSEDRRRSARSAARQEGESALLRHAHATARRRKSVVCPPPRKYSRSVALLGTDHVLAQRFLACLRRGHHDREFTAVHHRHAIGESQH